MEIATLWTLIWHVTVFLLGPNGRSPLNQNSQHRQQVPGKEIISQNITFFFDNTLESRITSPFPTRYPSCQSHLNPKATSKTEADRLNRRYAMKIDNFDRDAEYRFTADILERKLETNIAFNWLRYRTEMLSDLGK